MHTETEAARAAAAADQYAAVIAARPARHARQDREALADAYDKAGAALDAARSGYAAALKAFTAADAALNAAD